MHDLQYTTDPIERLYPRLWEDCVAAWAPFLGPTGQDFYDWVNTYYAQGTLVNFSPATSYGRTATDPQYSLVLDGINAYVDIGNNIPTIQQPTVAFWVNIGAFTDQSTIICKSDLTSSGFEWNIITQTTNKITFATPDGTLDSGTLSTGVWYFVCAYYDRINNTMGLYINDTLVTTTVTATAATAVGNLAIGQDPTNLIPFVNFNGSIDDIKYYNRILTPQEQADLYQGGRGYAYTRFTNTGSQTVFPFPVVQPSYCHNFCSLTVDHFQVLENGSYAVYLDHTNLPQDVFLKAQADGGDICFAENSDGSNRLACEIVLYNKPSQTCEIWVPVTLSTSTDKTFYVFYRSNRGTLTQPTASSAYGRNEVWSTIGNYAAVYHFGLPKYYGYTSTPLTNVDGTESTGLAPDTNLGNSYIGYQGGVWDSGSEPTPDTIINGCMVANNYNNLTNPSIGTAIGSVTKLTISAFISGQYSGDNIFVGFGTPGNATGIFLFNTTQGYATLSDNGYPLNNYGYTTIPPVSSSGVTRKYGPWQYYSVGFDGTASSSHRVVYSVDGIGTNSSITAGRDATSMQLSGQTFQIGSFGGYSAHAAADEVRIRKGVTDSVNRGATDYALMTSLTIILVGTPSGTLPSKGTATGTSTAIGRGTGIRSGTSSAAGNSTAQGRSGSQGHADGNSTAGGKMRITGTATGAATASGVAASRAKAKGKAVGAGSVAGSGASLNKAKGTAAGNSTAIGRKSAIANSTGTANGNSTATGKGKKLVPIVGTANGNSTATGKGRGLHKVVGTAAGNSTALAKMRITGRAIGVATATAVGESSHRSRGTAVGAGSASAVGYRGFRASANGTSTALGKPHRLISSAGTSAGSSSALSHPRIKGTAAGFATALANSGFGVKGTAAGISIATGHSSFGVKGTANGTSTALGKGRIKLVYSPDGGEVLTSGSADAFYRIFFDLDFTWQVKKTFLLQKNFFWNTGNPPLTWYRVEGCCTDLSGTNTDSGCSVAGLQNEDPTCGPQNFVQNFVANGIADLCRQLQNNNVKWKICSIKQFSLPADLSTLPPGADTCNILTEVPFCQIPACLGYCLQSDQKVNMVMSVAVYMVQTYSGSGSATFSGSAITSTTGDFYGTNFEYHPDGGEVLTSGSGLGTTSWDNNLEVDLRMTISIVSVKVNFGTQDTPTIAGITSTVSTPCGFCGAMPQILNFSHNLATSGVLVDFLQRNGLKLPSLLPMYYSSKLRGWVSTYHLIGIDNNNSSQKERWRFSFEWSCSNSLDGESLVNAFWTFSMLIVRTSYGSNFDTRLAIVFPPEQICDGSQNFSFDFSFKVNTITEFVSNNLNVALNQIILTDNIGLFSSKKWINNPFLKVQLSQSSTGISPTQYQDITAILPPQPVGV